ncbi:hypothetical protein [Actinoplanes sp. NPDC026670]|uniref:hypothetical protein n=1 Tax=Actinoplanes sp. NPDC026670 TaxID=3154700 RepID=UPI0033EDE862
MNDEQLDDLVRDADPYRSSGGADPSLLEEIMSVPHVPSRRRLVGAFAAAAAVTGVIGASVLLPDRTAPAPVAGPDVVLNTPAAVPSSVSTGGQGAGRQLDLAYAVRTPRLVIDESGWELQVIYGLTDGTGSVTYEKGDRNVDLSWYRADYYPSYLEDRSHTGRPVATRVAGSKAKIFTYSRRDFAVMLDPRDGTFVEIRVQGGGVDRAFVEELLTRIRQVGPDEFLAALPPEVITPGEAREATGKAVAGVPLPPGFDVDGLTPDGAYTPWQFRSRVAKGVMCGWTGEWVRAVEATDAPAAETAVAALRGSRNWPLLQDQTTQANWTVHIWQLIDELDPRKPRDFENQLGCDR